MFSSLYLTATLRGEKDAARENPSTPAWRVLCASTWRVVRYCDIDLESSRREPHASAQLLWFPDLTRQPRFESPRRRLRLEEEEDA